MAEKDYISREAAIEAIKGLYPAIPLVKLNIDKWHEKNKAYMECETAIERIPAADVQPVARASLVETREPIEGHPTWYRKHLLCSECGAQIRLESWDETRCFGAGTILRENAMPNFCPNCGADMREANDEKA